jgi:hypothetical protein
MRVVVVPQVVNQDAYIRMGIGGVAGTGDAGEHGDRTVNVGASWMSAACLSNWVWLTPHPSYFQANRYPLNLVAKLGESLVKSAE